jgi:hypothetical protein
VVSTCRTGDHPPSALARAASRTAVAVTAAKELSWPADVVNVGTAVLVGTGIRPVVLHASLDRGGYVAERIA